MPANKYALIRYRVIDRMITNPYRPYPNLEDLIDGCSETLGKQVSKSTLEKDLHAMKNDSALGYEAPIRYSKEYDGYYYEDPDFSISDIPLSDEEIDAIVIAANTLDQFKGIAIFNQYGAAIEKILNKVKLAPWEQRGTGSSIQFEQLPTVRGNEHLGQLFTAIQQRHVVTFEYASYKTGDRGVKQVEPYLLKEYSNRWYLLGFSRARADFRVYGLDRIQALVTTVERFDRQPNFDSDNFFKHSIGITANIQEQPEDVVLQCTPVLGKYLESQPLHESQAIQAHDAHWEIRLQVLLTYELEQKLLSFGNEVRVIQPENLKTKLVTTLQAALEQYNDL